MASGSISKRLTCQVCMEEFKQPKILPCGHTFCLDPCLQGLVLDGRLLCPTCQKSHNLDSDGVNGFTDNLLVAGTEDSLGISENYPQPPIEEPCQDCKKNIIEGGCDHCEKILCRSCLVKHSKILGEDLHKDLSKVKSLIQKFEHRISQLNVHQCEIEESGENIAAEMIQWRDQCISKIKSNAEDMIKEVRSAIKTEQGRYQPELDELKRKLAEIKDFYEKAEAKETDFAKYEGNASSIKQQQNKVNLLMKQSKELERKTSIPTTDVVRVTQENPQFDSRTGQLILTSISKFQGFVRSAQKKNDRGWAHEQISAEDALQSYRNKGKVKMFFGRKGNEDGFFKNPGEIAAISDGKIVVCDTGNHRIQVIDASGEFIRKFGSKGTGNGEFKSPWGVCVSPSGEIVVADTWNHRIQVFTIDGGFKRAFSKDGVDELKYPWSVAISKDNEVIVGDNTTSIKVFSLNGNFIRSFGESWVASSSPLFNNYKFVGTSPDGKVIVSEWREHRIGVFDESGQLIWEKGSKGDGDGQFNQPRGVTCDQLGNIIVADGANHRIQIFDKDGQFISSFGTKGSKPGQMALPSGVAVLASGDIAVSDGNNDRIQIF